MTTPDAFLTNCRLADRRLVDIGIADGKIAIVGEGAAPALSNSSTCIGPWWPAGHGVVAWKLAIGTVAVEPLVG